MPNCSKQSVLVSVRDIYFPCQDSDSSLSEIRLLRREAEPGSVRFMYLPDTIHRRFRMFILPRPWERGSSFQYGYCLEGGPARLDGPIPGLPA